MFILISKGHNVCYDSDALAFARCLFGPIIVGNSFSTRQTNAFVTIL